MENKIYNNLTMIDMYKLVFKDAVKLYVEGLNDSTEDYKYNITDEDINIVADKLVYDDDTLWKNINEDINYYLGRLLDEKEGQII